MTEIDNQLDKLDIDRTIVLVGMMGAGKTTVGRRLAPKLELSFVDADEEIERAAGMSIADLFRDHGQESFRRGEAQVIERLLEGPPIVLATGGGAMTDAKTREIIADKAISVWIDSDIDTLVKRATRRGSRPLLKTGDPKEILTRLMEDRKEFYSQATIRVESKKGPHRNTVLAILDAIKPYFTTKQTTSTPEAAT